MEQLLAHLAGDYILQSHDMATNKSKSSSWCLYHAFTYTIPFLFLTQNIESLFWVCIGHFIIDRFGLARYTVKLKNIWLGDLTKLNESETYNTNTGYPKETPDYMSIWLYIITDNTLHLIWNYNIVAR